MIIPPGLLPIQMEPLVFAVVLHVQLAEVGVEIVVGEHLAAAVIVDGITEDAWQTANLKTDALIANLAATTGIDPKLLETFNQNNLNALAAFQNRKVAGMNLSKRVWNITGTFTQEMELALSVALAEGRSADDISRDVRHLLKYPDKLFRRVRNEFRSNLSSFY